MGADGGLYVFSTLQYEQQIGVTVGPHQLICECYDAVWSRRKHGASPGGSRGFGDYASSFFNGFSSNHHGNSQQQQKSASPLGEESGSIFGVVVLLLLAFGVYKLFLSGSTNTHAPDQQGYHGDGTQPPPPGFRPDYTGRYTHTHTG